jgi:hypothetical protein
MNSKTKKERRTKMAFDRKGMRDDLLKRSQEQYDRRDSSGKFGSYIKDEFLEKIWKCVEGKHLIDVIPYQTGSKDPKVAAGIKKVGYSNFTLDLFIHRAVGPNQDSYLCLKRTYNKKCPICEQQMALRSSGEAEDVDIKALEPKRRNLYNIICYDSETQANKGVQLFEVSQWLFDKHLSARSKNSRTGEIIVYSHPSKEEGRSISFERKGSGVENTEFLAHNFELRDYDISEQDLNEAMILDEVIKIPAYEEVYEAYWGRKPTTETESQTKTNPNPKGEEEASGPPRTRRPLAQVAQPEKTNNRCPAGKTFGVDIDNLSECNECQEWDDCHEEEKKLKENDKKVVMKEAPKKEPEKPATGTGRLSRLKR